MKKILSSRHNANKQVCITLKSNEDKFINIPILKSAADELNVQVINTDDLLTKAEGIPHQTAGNKNLTRTEFIAIVLKVSNVVKVYAYMLKNENLANFVISSGNILSNKLRQNELLIYGKNLVKQIAPILTELTNYGLTEELTAELTKEVTEFENLLTEPRQLISERKTTHELIEEQIDDVYQLLINKIDPLMELFVDDKEFYLSYKSARMIVNPASRKRSEEVKEEEIVVVENI